MRICAIKGQTQHPFLSAKQLVNRYNLCLSGRAVRVTLCTFKHRSSVSERLVDYRPKNIHMFHPQPSSLAGASRPEKPSVQASLPPPFSQYATNRQATGENARRTGCTSRLSTVSGDATLLGGIRDPFPLHPALCSLADWRTRGGSRPLCCSLRRWYLRIHN